MQARFPPIRSLAWRQYARSGLAGNRARSHFIGQTPHALRSFTQRPAQRRRTLAGETPRTLARSAGATARETSPETVLIHFAEICARC